MSKRLPLRLVRLNQSNQISQVPRRPGQAPAVGSEDMLSGEPDASSQDMLGALRGQPSVENTAGPGCTGNPGSGPVSLYRTQQTAQGHSGWAGTRKDVAPPGFWILPPNSYRLKQGTLYSSLLGLATGPESTRARAVRAPSAHVVSSRLAPGAGGQALGWERSQQPTPRGPWPGKLSLPLPLIDRQEPRTHTEDTGQDCLHRCHFAKGTHSWSSPPCRR